ncbi:MAG: pyruvoyl-dependent arginine decarboxylase [Ramlibacter sp.]|nr:pyruvoyl-dependent arginine decarboxylase [Ramlibacter sp.]
MDIQIATGTGSSSTKLAAFDASLFNAGVSNYNLIRLSSIIPPGSVICVDSPIKKQPGGWGDRLYCVVAEMRVDTPGMQAWAGIGWVQEKSSGKGLFVEHEGYSEQSVRNDIEASLGELQQIRNVDFGEIQMKMVGRTCVAEPVCALVVAVFSACAWSAGNEAVQ